MATGKLSGKNGAVKVNNGVSTAVLCVKSWSFNQTSDMVDVTDTCSGGFAEYIATFRRGDGSFEAFFNESSPPALVPGQAVTLYLITDTTIGAGIGYYFSALVSSVAIALDVAGAVTYNGNFQATGAVTQYTVSN